MKAHIQTVEKKGGTAKLRTSRVSLRGSGDEGVEALVSDEKEKLIEILVSHRRNPFR